MNKVIDTLWTNYKKVNEQIEGLDVSDGQYQVLLEERDKIRNELIKIEQATMEIDVKKNQIEAENNREKKRNIITVGTFIVTTGISMYAIARTFRFDQEATITSTLGRGILNGVVPKMFKR